MNNYGRSALVFLVSVLVVTALGSGIVASQQEAESYAVEQGGDCVELDPLSYEDRSVEAFYDYSTGDSESATPYSANTPIGLEETNEEASSLFLYEGPEGTSLVFLHGAVNDTGGGAATLQFAGLPDEGEWVVKDDPENESVDQWNRTTETGQIVDWSWRNQYTDGGAYHGGLDEEFEVSIDPAFNDDATFDPLTSGNVTEWRALSLSDGTVEAVELDMDRQITVRTGDCS